LGQRIQDGPERHGPVLASMGGRALKTAGFSLLEVVVATAVVMAATASLALLFVVSAYAARNANAA